MKRASILTLLLICSGCATMINGRYQTVSVDSYPSGSRIAVDCGDVSHEGGTTPAKVRLQRGADHCALTFSKAGFEVKRLELLRQRSRATQANKIAALPLALITGVVAGAIGEDALNAGAEFGEAGFRAGMEAGAAPGRQIDKHTGAAYKWVPGDIFVKLVREQQPAEARR